MRAHLNPNQAKLYIDKDSGYISETQMKRAVV